MGALGNIIGKVVVGIGTVLSLIPVTAPVGVAVAAAGVALANANPTSNDSVSNAATQTATKLVSTSQLVNASATAAAGGSVINLSSIMTWLKSNWLLVAGIIAGIIFLPKLLKRRR
jgi:hypothetical protein